RGYPRADNRRRRDHPSLCISDHSIKLSFGHRFMRTVERMRVGILFSDETMMPNSSLAHYLALALQEFGAPGSRHFVGPDGMDVDGLCAALEAAQAERTPFALLGASYSYVHLMDELERRGCRYALPSGSRLFD